jgi:serine/threonine protein kinase
VGGQAAEQIIAGVVLSERLGVTMYGAIHRAQFGGQRNLRGLVVDPKMLAEDAFRIPLTDARALGTVTKLAHASIVPTMTVESGGPDVVVVTRGAGRYVTVQDLITAAKAKKAGGRLPLPIAALIGKSVIEALAVAHKAGVIHGAVHPRSVLVDEDGSVKLDDFVVGRALTTAVAQGADSSLWRGLTGYIAPELVVGEDPAPGADVFAVGAMLFTMLSGEAPPGSLRVTPAIERLVQRALDTDPQRRYKTATDLLDNLVEAMEDDRWEIAERGELIREAGLQASEGNIDDATEDLLASLGEKSVIVTSQRAEMKRASSPASARLDSLIQDMSSDTGLTAVDEKPFRRDPISELIRQEPRKKEAIVSAARVPSLDDPDDPDDETPLPPPARESDLDMTRSENPSGPKKRPSALMNSRSATADENAALAAIGGLDAGAKRVSTAAEQASAAAEKLEQAAARAEAASRRAEASQPVRRAAPIVDPVQITDLPTPRLKSRMVGVVSFLVIAGVVAFGYWAYQNQEKKAAAAKAEKAKHDLDEEAARAQKNAEAPDPGDLVISSNPGEAGVWLHLGKTPLDTFRLDAQNSHELMLMRDGFDATEVQVGGTAWSGNKDEHTLKATVKGTLKKAGKKPAALPLQPAALHITSGIAGDGPIHVESDPSGADAYLFVGITGTMRLQKIIAGRDYEFVVVKDGFKPATVTIKADDWRDNDPTAPIDVAKKKPVLERTVELEPAKGK